MTIKSKIFNYGSEHESVWPPRYPESTRGCVGYIDPETKEYREGYPPNPNNNFGTAATVIFDAMPPAYHERACRTVDSRAEWDRLDKETGSLTFGSTEEPRRHMKKASIELQRDLRRDRRRASQEALKMVRANPKEINQKLNKQAEKQAEAAKKAGLDKVLKTQGIDI